MMKKNIKRLYTSSSISSFFRFFLFLFFLFGLIEITISVFRLSPAAFARPSEIFFSVYAFFLPSMMLPDVLGTIQRTLLAFILSFPVGIVFGIIASKSKYFDNELKFTIDFLRSIPATALIPLFLVLFGPHDLSKIAVGVFSGALSIAISVVVGEKSLNQDRKVVADLLKLRGFKRIILYELPEMAPVIFVGSRTAASLCLILVVVGEMFIGSNNGLGKVIMDTRYSDDVPTLYAAIVMTGVIGFFINFIFIYFEKRIKEYL